MKQTYFPLFLIIVAGLAPLMIFSTAQAQFADGQTKFLGNIHTKGQTPLNFDMYWNQVTPGNAGKWASCEQARDDMNYWLWFDRAYSHAKQNGFAFKEHTLVWGHYSGEPSWMSSVPANEQMDEVVEWFEAVAERYPDIDMIDVVNEPLHAPPSYKDALGGAGATGWDWVIWSFEKARELFPNAILILNEYNVLNYTSECQNFLVIVKLLQDRGLIDAVGLQGHSLESISFSTIQQNLEAVAATGLDIYISEYEARGDDATQLALYQQHLPYFWEHPSVKGITLWGYLEGDMWRSEAYLLAADGTTERPALEWLHSYFNYHPQNVRYRLDAGAEGSGTIQLTPAGGIYTPFTSVTATAVANAGYLFSHWTGDKGGSENPTTLAMTSNRLLTAHFVEQGQVPEYTLSVSVSGNGQVTQTPQGTSFPEGTVVTLTATPDTGYRFAGWSGSVQSSNVAITLTMDGNKALSATFAETGAGQCASETAISMPFSHSGAGEFCWVATGQMNYINSWNMQYVEVNGQDFTNHWAGQVPSSADGKIHIHCMATVPYAYFEITGTDSETPTSTQYNLTVNVAGQGSVTPTGGTYAAGTVVTLTATPASGYTFDGWSGDVSGSAASITVTMDADTSVTATFTAEDSGTGGCDGGDTTGGCGN